MYKSFKEAKVANPESEIYIHGGEFIAESKIKPSHLTYERRGYVKCKPADYCQNWTQFKKEGVLLDVGDWVIGNINGNAFQLDNDCLGEWNSNEPGSCDDLIFILTCKALDIANDVIAQDNEAAELKAFQEAKAPLLSAWWVFKFNTHGVPYQHDGPHSNREEAEHARQSLMGMNKMDKFAIGKSEIAQEKPTQIKIEYENVGFHKAHEAMHEHEMVSPLYVLDDFGFEKAELHQVANGYVKLLYRRIEVPVTDRELFIEEAMKMAPKDGNVYNFEADSFVKALFDSGKFKLADKSE